MLIPQSPWSTFCTKYGLDHDGKNVPHAGISIYCNQQLFHFSVVLLVFNSRIRFSHFFGHRGCLGECLVHCGREMQDRRRGEK